MVHLVEPQPGGQRGDLVVDGGARRGVERLVLVHRGHPQDAGVAIGGLDGLTASLRDPIALGIIAGLVLGKPIGILGTAWLTARFTHANLDDELTWLDVLGVSLLGGIGFTVSLLIGDLAFGAGSTADDHVKVAILTGSLASGLLAAVLVKSRDRTYERMAAAEEEDSDADGIPDVYQSVPAPLRAKGGQGPTGPAEPIL